MSTAVATTAAKQPPAVQSRKTIQAFLEGPEFTAQIAKSLPTHLKPDRFIRVALTAMTKTPKLAECDQASFFKCLLDLSSFGLEPDGRRAHLIPYRNNKLGITECQLIIDWKGLAELAMRSGLVANLHADVVSDGDVFEYSMGKLSKHVPWFLRRDADKPKEPGEFIAAYAVANFKDGTSKAEVLSIGEVDGIRARSKSKDAGPWVTDFSEMAKKTAFRRLSKWLPLSPEFRDAVERDDDVIDIHSRPAGNPLTGLLSGPPATEPPPPQIEAHDRDAIVREIEDVLLDNNTGDALALKAAMAANVIENADGLALFELPTTDLVSVLAYLRAKSAPATSTAKGA
jgi:recombination protein RecT